jgi:hypothetical protein
MERFESLINSLKNSYENGVDKAQLLNLVDQMRHELVSTPVVSDHTNAPVSIWLPTGYQQKPIVADTPVVAVTDMAGDKDAVNESSFLSIASIEADIPDSTSPPPEDILNNEITASNEDVVQIIGGVPKPPMYITEEHEELSPIFPKNEELVALESPIIEIEQSVAVEEEGSSYVISEVEEASALPQVFELSVEIPETEAFVLSEESTISIPPGFLVGDVSPAALITKPKELHEILANRVVAKEEPVKIQSRILADSLSATKIHDLKKSIGINDRFRFIKSLFRGDESLFDRSVKTINNFNILPEAEYWIQRELVIKLGWNEEDELVQQFYNLVNRRFL